MVVFSPERNKPFKCKKILLFCLPDWELTEMGLLRSFLEIYIQFSGPDTVLLFLQVKSILAF